jgi:adenine-specific DNA-methyltransferase
MVSAVVIVPPPLEGVLGTWHRMAEPAPTSCRVVEGGVHMSEVELTWPNKELTLRASGSNAYEWLQPNDPRLFAPLSLNCLTASQPDAHSNVLAIGDGLDVLDALRQNSTVLRAGIRLVYIDPPFNTQVNFRQYKDTMQRPMWLSMMRDRLTALKPFLAADASVWVHLDDAEVHRARAVMDEVFGEKAFVTSIVWQKKTTRDSRAAFSSNHDTVLVYAPSGPRKWKTSRNLLTKDESQLRNRDDDPRGPWTDAPFTAPGYRPAQQYDIVTPTGRVLQPPRGRSWYATEPTYLDLLAEDRIWFPKDGDGSPRIKLFAHQLRGLVPFTVWGASDTGTNDDAKRHLLTMFPDLEVFDTPKPESLLERIVHIATNPGELVVDIFGGSGTTAAVAHKMHRRWLLVERSVQTVLDFTLPRLRHVTAGSDRGGITPVVAWSGGGEFSIVQVDPRLGVPLSPGDRTAVARVNEALSALERQDRAVSGVA